MSHTLINLAYLNIRPTGLMTYGVNVVQHLRSLDLTLLSPTAIADLPLHSIPTHMTADQGSKGHLRRLLWTQFRLPALYRQLKGTLLFSPIPEAPLGAGMPTVVTVHDLIPLRFPRRGSPLTLYSRHYVPQVLRQADHIIANSEATARDVVEFFSIPAKKITPIPLAYNAEHFRVVDLPTQPYFLYLGRPDPHKNVPRLIEAFARLPVTPHSELWLAGTPDPKATPQLIQQAKDLGVGDRLRVFDYVAYEELPALIGQAIALVLPSLWEGFGLPVLEAMACGTPVITSNLSSLPEVAGDAALLVDPYDVEDMTQAMRRLLLDGDARSQLREAGLKRVKQFSWAKTGAATADILRRYV